MTYDIAYWDSNTNSQKTRVATPAEAAEIDARIAAAPAAVKLTKWEAIKARREQAKNGGMQVAGNWFQTDADSRIQYLGLKDKARDVLAVGGTYSTALTQGGKALQWKTYTNTFVPVTVQLAIDLVAAVADLDALAFACAEQHRLAMLAAPNPATYDYSTGWPASYGA